MISAPVPDLCGQGHGLLKYAIALVTRQPVTSINLGFSGSKETNNSLLDIGDNLMGMVIWMKQVNAAI